MHKPVRNLVGILLLLITISTVAQATAQQHRQAAR